MASTSVNDLFGVQGLVAVVTGGGSGIGLMIAQGLENNGAFVYVLGRRKEALVDAVNSAKHGNIFPLQADVTSKESLQGAVDQVKEKHGFVNVVVANSGITGPGLKGLPQDPSISQLRNHLLGWDTEELNNVFAVNNVGVINTVVAFLELLDAGNKKGNLKQKSQVIATASVGAFNRSPVAGYAYGSSKAGVVHLMKSFATGLVPYDIRANVIAPGFFPSAMTEDLMKKQNEEGWPKSMVPEGRPGNAQDLAGAVLFLTSLAGSYVNGNVLISDGGRVGVIPSSY